MGNKTDTRRWRRGSLNEKQKLIGEHNSSWLDKNGWRINGRSFFHTLERRRNRRTLKMLIAAELAEILTNLDDEEVSFSRATGLKDGERPLVATVINRHSVIIKTSLGRIIVLN